MINVKDLSKHFGDIKAVDAVNLEVKKGELFGLLGPNGSGKTTMIKMLTGQIKPTAGAVSVHGVDVLTTPFESKRAYRHHSRTGNATKLPDSRGIPAFRCKDQEA